MKNVLFVLLCAASVALVGCKKENKEEEPKVPKYSVSDEVDINVMKTIATQFTIDTAQMVSVIKGLGFTYRVKADETIKFYRSSAEALSECNPVIRMSFRTSGYTEQVSYSSYTSFNVVSNKAQIISQLGDTVVVYGRDFLFYNACASSGEWTTSIKDFMPQLTSATTEVRAEWFMKAGKAPIELLVLYEEDKDYTFIYFSCDAPDMIE